MSAPYYQDEQVTLHQGDCLDVLAELPDNSIDAVVTDPPYGLEFMGKDWDRPWAVSPTQSVGFAGREANLTLPSFGDNRNANCRACGGRQRGAKRCACPTPKWDRDPASDMREFQSWCETWAIECLRVLKPGGHMLAFGGTRTWHRLSCAVEDAGFEIRDSIAWLYGSGFPKSLDVSKAIDRAAGAEREVVGQKTGRAAQPRTDMRGGNYGSGTSKPAAIDLSAVTAPATDAAKEWQGWGTALKPAFEPIVVARKPLQGTVAANVQTYGAGALNIDACRVGHANAADLAASQAKNPGRSDTVTSGVYGADRSQQVINTAGRWPANVLLDDTQAAELDQQSGTLTSGGGVKAKPGSLNGYCEDRTSVRKAAGISFGSSDSGGASRFFPTFRYTAKAPGTERPTADGIAHPTVKPLELMRWLIRLVTPPGGVVLDPFAGSGTTGEAAIHEHMNAILIEREPTYLPLIVARLSKPMAVGFDYGDAS